jgi:hypothetical protein
VSWDIRAVRAISVRDMSNVGVLVGILAILDLFGIVGAKKIIRDIRVV